MKNNILVIVPSKQNPAGARRLLKTFKETSTRGSDLVMFVDGEGYDAAPYILGYEGHYGKSVVDIARRYLPNHDYFMFAQDEMVFYTPGWDRKLISVFDTVGSNIIVSGQHGVAPTIPRGMLSRVDFRVMETLDEVEAVWRFFVNLPMNFHTQVDFGINADWKFKHETAVEKEWLQADGDTLDKEVRTYAIGLRRQRDTTLSR